MLFPFQSRARAWKLGFLIALWAPILSAWSTTDAQQGPTATVSEAVEEAASDGAERPSDPAAEAEETDDAPSNADADTASQSEAARLLAEGDRLAKEKKYEEALTQYKNAYERLVPSIRKLPMKHPIQPRFMTRSQLKDYIVAELEKEVSDEEMKRMDRALKVFGFVPASMNVEELLINLYTEQIGGFYNARTKEMFLILEDPVKRTILTRWFKGDEFNTAEQRTTLSHEMTHALADQHFDLSALDNATRHNEDMAMAVAALVEGEATLVMMSEMLKGEATSELLVQIEPARMDATFQILNVTMSIFGGRTMRTAPSIFRRTLVFPYHKGIVFVLHLTNRNGWDAINQAFRDPPLSTEQILHPEKYWGERDVPTGIELPELAEQLGDAWTSLGSDTLGELQMSILFERHSTGDAAAAGWDGDRYEVYERADGQLGLTWFTTWDSPQDAAEFADQVSRYFVELRAGDNTEGRAATKLDDDALAEQLAAAFAKGESSDERNQGEWKHAFANDEIRVMWRGDDVVVLAGFSAEENEKITPVVWQSVKAPVHLVRDLPAGDSAEATPAE